MAVSLSEELEEISGLCNTDINELAVIQDEEGILYKINKQTGRITNRHSFGKEGDYEGIALYGDSFYALKSNGTLYKFNANGSSQKIKTGLNEKNDCEGLCVLPQKNKLLIACKGKSGTKVNGIKGGRAVYVYDIEKERLIDYPVFTIYPKQIKESNYNLKRKHYEKFAPSGIAVHPKSGNIYILAHQGRLLLVLSPDFQLLSSNILPKFVFSQAEGICFDKNADMYISCEIGDTESARLLKFSPK